MKSLVIVIMVAIQVFVSVMVALAIIYFLLLTSGDVEQNPGPEQTDREVGVKQFIKSGLITNPDRLFNNLSIDICDKYTEIGIELGLKIEVLRNELETGSAAMLLGSKKAIKMLQLWRDSVSQDEFTYSVLAAALEKHGFQRCAYQYCYSAGPSYESELNRLLEREGYVNLTICKLLITGAAGSGKTCTKHILYQLEPPGERESTELFDTVKSRNLTLDFACTESNEHDWLIIDSVNHDLYSMLAATVISEECEYEYRDATASSVSRQTSPANPEQNESFPAEFAAANPLPPLSRKSTISKAKHFLLKQLKNPDNSGKCIHRVHWIYMTDSGGQSQFHDILPAFLHNTSVILYVLKLSETLDEQPFDDYYIKEQRIGESRKSPYHVEQILKGVIQSICYEKDRDLDVNKAKVLIIGTFKEEEKDCSESLKEKNEKLKSLFHPFVDCDVNKLDVIYHGDNNEIDIIFPLDAKEQDSVSKQTAKDIRREVNTRCTGSSKRIPISWFLLEEDIKIIGSKNEHPHGILKLTDCEQVVQDLAIPSQTLSLALRYFHDLNIFFYFPNSNLLSQFVFTKPQVVVTILSAFVKEAYRLRSNQSKLNDTENIRFIKKGQFTQAFVLSVPNLKRFIVPDVGFGIREMIELLMITLVVAPINEQDLVYFMPCVLQHCPPEEIIKCEASTQSVPPVVIKLPGQCVPRGFFCALACSLLRFRDSQWTLKSTEVFKNCVYYDIKDMRCSVAIFDSFYFISVHVFGECGRGECEGILDDIKQSIKEVVVKHNYDADLVMSYDKQLHFLCNCGKTPEHIATLSTRGGLKLVCQTVKHQHLEIEEKHAMWFADKQYLMWQSIELEKLQHEKLEREKLKKLEREKLEKLECEKLKKIENLEREKLELCEKLEYLEKLERERNEKDTRHSKCKFNCIVIIVSVLIVVLAVVLSVTLTHPLLGYSYPT